MELSELAYGGSRLLDPLSRKIGLPIDQTNFLVCLSLSVIIAYPFRTWLSYKQVGATIRHCVEIFFGLLLTYFCFGTSMYHLVLQSVTCYIAMMFIKPGIMEKLVFVIAMGYLCAAHITRLLDDYGGYVLDISGPLMLNTQKLSALAFALADGKLKDDSKLPPLLKQRLIKRLPNALEFVSYMFSFHMAMCGPFCFYHDYKNFIEGTHVLPKVKVQDNMVTNNNTNNNTRSPNNAASQLLPLPTRWVIKKLLTALVFGSMTVFLHPHFLIVYMADSQFFAMSWLSRVVYIIICTSMNRVKYYFAWKLAEAGNVNAGLGFNGYSESGDAQWNLIDNADIVAIESATSLKGCLDNWNKTTMYWLRYCVYERCHSTMAVFLFSAFWHGFYIGYYVTFFHGAVFILVSRRVRRSIRPYFQASRSLAALYDVITAVVAHITLAYVVWPFAIVSVWQIFDIYKSLYFFMHIGAAAILLVTYVLPKAPGSGASKGSRQKDE